MPQLRLAEINGLELGQKRNDADRMYWRKRRDGAVTAYQRVRLPTGQTKDVPLETVRRKVLKADLNRLRAEGAELRANPSQLVPAPTREVNGLSCESPLSQVWDVFLAAVTGANGSWSQDYGTKMQGRMENHLSRMKLWAMPVGEIGSPDIYEALFSLHHTKPDTERKIRSGLSKAFDYLLGLGVIKGNPVPHVAKIYRSTTKKQPARNLPAITHWQGLGEILRANEYSNASFLVRAATLLQAYTCQRVSDVVEAQRQEFDLEAGTWTIPRNRKKMKEADRGDQVIHLPPQALALVSKVPKAAYSDRLFAARNKTG